MSNTDGEDTQKVSLGELLLNAGTRIVDLEKQSNDQVEIITHLDQELASLREQLFVEQQLVKVKQKEKEMMAIKLKHKEDENRELRKAVLHYFDTRNGWGHEGALDAMKAKDDLIQKAKNLSA